MSRSMYEPGFSYIYFLIASSRPMTRFPNFSNSPTPVDAFLDHTYYITHVLSFLLQSSRPTRRSRFSWPLMELLSQSR